MIMHSWPHYRYVSTKLFSAIGKVQDCQGIEAMSYKQSFLALHVQLLTLGFMYTALPYINIHLDLLTMSHYYTCHLLGLRDDVLPVASIYC